MFECVLFERDYLFLQDWMRKVRCVLRTRTGTDHTERKSRSKTVQNGSAVDSVEKSLSSLVATLDARPHAQRELPGMNACFDGFFLIPPKSVISNHAKLDTFRYSSFFFLLTFWGGPEGFN